ncbi:hypothetical protein [Rubinisphaera sp.]|uniref:hypothetical protein n=2 Tax=Rubinisphaera TaxID=1649490 RepID=UPI000C0D6037|nr:hypothetical protein [Rubinisphaera sp.]MBV11002.1 hypothetical protein [Rubinisphaera sp.]|tara:strand:- start:9712 stop:10215 length:504 start_codon:yes stop_codon:yes gene_type:complete
MGKSESSRMAWFVCGVMGGLMISYFWPSEVAMANTDRDSDAKFAIVTVPVGLTAGDAVFVLDFLTGRLYGASINPQTAKFTQGYMHNVLPDFGLSPDVRPRFVMTSGALNISVQGSRKQPATGGVYIAELNSGRVLAYAFPFSLSPRASNPEPLTIVDGFQFRQTVE